MTEKRYESTPEMAPMAEAARPTDWAGGARTFLVLWGLPIAVLIVSGAVAGGAARPVAWPLALGWMGGACLLNAVRCGRLHCFITGPLFLGLGLLALLHGLGVVPLGDDGWRWLGGVTLVGGIGLTYAPEWIWGRYIGGGNVA